MEFSTKDIIEEIRNREKCTLKDASYLADLFISVIESKLKDQQCTKLRIKNIGVFSKTYTKGHIGRNPQTGAAVEVSPMIKISFKPAVSLRTDLNETMEVVSDGSLY